MNTVITRIFEMVFFNPFLEDMNPVKGSSTMPVGFAGYYELIGVVSHMVDMRRRE